MLLNNSNRKDQSGAPYASVTGISGTDQNRLKSLGEAYGKAQDAATKASLHSQAEAIRAQYGYSGGADGSQHIAIPKNLYSGTNYARDAHYAAAAGDWDSVDTALSKRDSKIAATGNNYGTTSYQIYQDLINQYGGPKKDTGELDALKEQLYAQQLELNALKNAGQQNADPIIAELKGMYENQNNLYAEALAAQKAANDAAVKSAVNKYNSQKIGLDTQYADMFRQLYLNKMRNQKDLDQRLAFSGQSGGQAESTMLGFDTAYADALRDGVQSKAGALGEIDRAITEAELNGNITNAAAMAESAVNRANSYADVLKSLIERSDRINRQDAALRAEETAKNRSYAYQTAMALLQGGNMASDELLDSAGISKADARAMVNQAAAQIAAPEGVYKKPAKITDAQVGFAYDAFMSGDRSKSVISVLESYYGQPIAVIAKKFGVDFSGKTRIKGNFIENYATFKLNAANIARSQGRQAAINYLKELRTAGGIPAIFYMALVKNYM